MILVHRGTRRNLSPENAHAVHNEKLGRKLWEPIQVTKTCSACKNKPKRKTNHTSMKVFHKHSASPIQQDYYPCPQATVLPGEETCTKVWVREGWRA